MRMTKLLLAGLLAASFTTTTLAEDNPVFMSAEWANAACNAWNQDPVLTDKLNDKWVKNHGGKGHKIMQIYREGCESSPRVEMHVAEQNGKAMCTYGGAVKSTELSKKHDYLMWAKDKHWERMGNGKDGPMKAMMFGRLNFKGPKMEAMGNMGPFGNFLKLTGTIPSDRSKCP